VVLPHAPSHEREGDRVAAGGGEERSRSPEGGEEPSLEEEPSASVLGMHAATTGAVFGEGGEDEVGDTEDEEEDVFGLTEPSEAVLGSRAAVTETEEAFPEGAGGEEEVSNPLEPVGPVPVGPAAATITATAAGQSGGDELGAAAVRNTGGAAEGGSDAGGDAEAPPAGQEAGAATAACLDSASDSEVAPAVRSVDAAAAVDEVEAVEADTGGSGGGGGPSLSAGEGGLDPDPDPAVVGRLEEVSRGAVESAGTAGGVAHNSGGGQGSAGEPGAGAVRDSETAVDGIGGGADASDGGTGAGKTLPNGEGAGAIVNEEGSIVAKASSLGGEGEADAQRPGGDASGPEGRKEDKALEGECGEDDVVFLQVIVRLGRRWSVVSCADISPAT